MLREADHCEQVKRLRIGEKDVAALVPAYEVLVFSVVIIVTDLLEGRTRTIERRLCSNIE